MAEAMVFAVYMPPHDPGPGTGGRYSGHGLRKESIVQMDFASPVEGTPTVPVRFMLVEVGRRYAIWQCVQIGEIAVQDGLRVQITLDLPEVQ